MNRDQCLGRLGPDLELEEQSPDYERDDTGRRLPPYTYTSV